jgi:hypothetical protein
MESGDNPTRSWEFDWLIWDKGLQGSPGWPWTHGPPASASKYWVGRHVHLAWPQICFYYI